MRLGFTTTVVGAHDPYPQKHAIVIDGSCPSDYTKKQFLSDAKDVMVVLQKLPSGTFLRVLREMLRIEIETGGESQGLAVAFDIINKRAQDHESPISQP